MMHKYSDFQKILAKTKDLYACALYKCECDNFEEVEKITHQYEILQNELEKKYLAIQDLSEMDNQWLKYEDIIKAAPKDKVLCHPLNVNTLPDKMAGAIMGRLAGCILGVPVENWHPEDIRDMANQFGDDFPPKDYWKNVYYPSQQLHHGWATRKEYTRDGMDGAPVDDDTGYTILNLLVLEKYGCDFKTSDVAKIWMEYLPFAHSAEKIALENIKIGVPVDEIATKSNPYVEWIGAYIRSDAWGWSCAGNPDKASKLAWKDGILTHRKNGLYGEMFFAAVEAAAFAETSIEDVLRIGLNYIPEKSELSKDIRWAISEKDNVRSWKDAVKLVNQRFRGMSKVHTNNNACLVVFGLFLGENDLTKTIGNVVAMGYDNDCNAATAGSIVGAMIGKANIEEKWYRPFRGMVKSYIKNHELMKIDDLIEDYLLQANKMIGDSKV